MAFHSVVDIDVNDEKFQQFYKLFQEYEERTKNVPESWKQAEEQIRKAASAAKKLSQTSWSAKEFRTMREEMKKTTDESKKFHLYTMRSAMQMHKMASDAKNIGKTFLGIGKTVARMSGWGIGLVGAALFGLDRLGSSAVSGQHQARGMGLNQGQTRAWETYFGKSYLGSGSVQNVANSQADRNQWANLIPALQGSGLTLPQALSMPADKLTFLLAQSEARRWNSDSPMMRANDPFLKGQEVILGGGSAEARVLAAAQSRGELTKAWKNYQKASAQWKVSDSTTDAWRSFTQSLSAAGHQLETVLINRLAALAPYMKDFVDSVVKDATAFLDSTLTPENIRAMGKGVKSIADFLGSPAFVKDAKQAGEALSDLVHAILWAAKKLDALKTPSIPKSFVQHPLGHFGIHHAKLPSHATTGQKIENFLFGRDPFKVSSVHGPHVSGFIGGPSSLNQKAYISALEKQYGLPAGMEWGVYGAESSYGKNAGLSSAGALGPMQFTKSTAKALGLKDRTNFAQSARAAARLLAQDFRIYHGDVAKTLAAYNAGTVKVDAAIASKGTHWMEALPAETRAYVPKVTLVIDNRAGANIYSLANAAGY